MCNHIQLLKNLIRSNSSLSILLHIHTFATETAHRKGTNFATAPLLISSLRLYWKLTFSNSSLRIWILSFKRIYPKTIITYLTFINSTKFTHHLLYPQRICPFRTNNAGKWSELFVYHVSVFVLFIYSRNNTAFW